MIYAVLIVLGVIVADQALKWWVVANIPLGATILKNPVLDLTYLQNRGAAWSMFSGNKWLLLLIAFVATIVLILLIIKSYRYHKVLTIGLSLALGGALGNVIDRVRLGYVVDMFQVEFFNFPIFNLADIALFIGVVIIIVAILRDEK